MKHTISEKENEGLICKNEGISTMITNKPLWPWQNVRGKCQFKGRCAFIAYLLKKNNEILEEIGQIMKELKGQALRMTKAMEKDKIF